LSDAERALVGEVETAYRGETRMTAPPAANCMPCPSGVDIPRNFAQYNTYYMFMQDALVKADYRGSPKPNARVFARLRDCEELCPQQLPIREHLKAVTAAFAGV